MVPKVGGRILLGDAEVFFIIIIICTKWALV